MATRGEITLLYVKSRSMGYGRAGCDLADGLTAMGVDVYNSLGEPPQDVVVSKAHRPKPDSRPPSTPTANVCWVSVPGHANWWYEGQRPSVFSMWEAEVLPESFRENLHEFDQIIVPSLQNVELFGRYHNDVKFVPLGVDPAQWHFYKRPPVTDTFRFLIGGSGKRKGTDLAHRAFRTVFPRPDTLDVKPVLVMKNPRGEDFYGPGIEMVTGRLTDEEEIALYESCHAYVQPSRGEGFGLQPLQAMAQGMPTILTNAHGHESFAHLGIPLSWKWDTADYFIYGDAGRWWEPDFDELCEAMWDVYSNYEPHRDLAQLSAQTVAEKWTTTETARKFAECFDLEAPRPASIKQHAASWGQVVTPEHKLYPVVVTRQYVADVSDQKLIFEPGREYYEPADIKRILFEAGVLDPSCLEKFHSGTETGTFDSGLHPMQLGRKEDYAAEHSFCPLCSQQLNTRPTAADFHLAAREFEIEAESMVANAGSLG